MASSSQLGALCVATLLLAIAGLSHVHQADAAVLSLINTSKTAVNVTVTVNATDGSLLLTSAALGAAANVSLQLAPLGVTVTATISITNPLTAANATLLQDVTDFTSLVVSDAPGVVNAVVITLGTLVAGVLTLVRVITSSL